MQLLVFACAMVLVSCSGAKSPPPTKAAPPIAPMDQARAYELGDGVARDYASAAKIYEQQCSSGTGSLVACRKLTQALLKGRGVDRDLERSIALARTLCDTRSDPPSCLLVVYAAMTAPGAGNEDIDDEANAANEKGLSEKTVATLKTFLALPCDEQHVARCEMPRDPFSWADRSSSGQRGDREFDAQACKLGVLDACLRMRGASEEEMQRGLARLETACRKGDADICDELMQPIDAAALCKANDYAKCAALGCAGDMAAAQVAAEHRQPVDCEGRMALDPLAAGITPSNVPVFDSVAFTPLKTPTNAPLRYQIANRSTKTIEGFHGTVYGYDASGAQVERRTYEIMNVRLQPGRATTLEVGYVEGVSFDPCIEVIAFREPNTLGDESYLARCPVQKARGARWGDGNAPVVLEVYFGDLPLADDWIHTFDPMLAEPFEQTHPGIRVRSVTGNTALTMPFAGAGDRASIEIPFVRQPTVIAFRVTGVDDLQLSPATLAKIFQGRIKTWNDPAIAKDNPKAKLPSIPIVVFQSDNQNDQLRLTTYLTNTARGVWKPTKQGEVRKGITFVRAYDIEREVASREGAILSVGAGIAEKAKMRVAKIMNARGAFVAPTPDAITRGDYPMVTARSLAVRIDHPDQATADAARSYATWLATDALPIFERMGFGFEPEAARQAALKKLSTLTVTKPKP